MRVDSKGQSSIGEMKKTFQMDVSSKASIGFYSATITQMTSNGFIIRALE